MSDDERIELAIRNTRVLRPPRQTLATFGNTNIHYYLVTEPIYEGLDSEPKEPAGRETVVREGKVVAERPRVVTPHYLVNVEGFSEHARRYINKLMQEQGANVPGIFYNYKNEPKELSIVSSDLESVARRISDQIDKEGNPLAAIIKGSDELWDVSLLKFIFEMTHNSLSSNIYEMGSRGLLDIDRGGMPRDARITIERLFYQVQKGEVDPSDLKLELDRWGVFKEYEDRFLRLFRK
ncbi:MAG: hypothetical protein HY665_09270 [Chloroflexi bacterium]|nr:hypothetical protein [Chloroflexota bacterium]